jgi:hypothetical protein
MILILEIIMDLYKKIKKNKKLILKKSGTILNRVMIKKIRIKMYIF